MYYIYYQIVMNFLCENNNKRVVDMKKKFVLGIIQYHLIEYSH